MDDSGGDLALCPCGRLFAHCDSDHRPHGTALLVRCHTHPRLRVRLASERARPAATRRRARLRDSIRPWELGMWCFESAWASNPLYRGSVEPTLDLMGRERRIRYEHDRVRRLSQLEEALDQWTRKRAFPVGYLALHGNSGTVFVGRKELSLADFGQLAGRCDGKIILFAGCRTFIGDGHLSATDRARVRGLANDCCPRTSRSRPVLGADGAPCSAPIAPRARRRSRRPSRRSS
jgi:hypothetical protein